MKISQREKALLTILSAVLILAVSYFTLFKAQFENLDALAIENAASKQELARVNNELASGLQLDAMVVELQDVLLEKTNKYYPDILQNKIIVLLDQLSVKAEIISDSYSFSPVTVQSITSSPDSTAGESSYKLYDYAQQYKALNSEEDEADDSTAEQSGDGAVTDTGGQQEQGPPESQVSSLQVSMNMRGSYQQVKRFISEIEALGRSILIKNLNMASDQEGLISADIQLEFIALPKLDDTGDVDYVWPYNNGYGKVNPFQ